MFKFELGFLKCESRRSSWWRVCMMLVLLIECFHQGEVLSMAVQASCAALAGSDFSPVSVLSSPSFLGLAFPNSPSHNAPCPNTSNKTEMGEPSVECRSLENGLRRTPTGRPPSDGLIPFTLRFDCYGGQDNSSWDESSVIQSDLFCLTGVLRGIREQLRVKMAAIFNVLCRCAPELRQSTGGRRKS